MRNTILIVDDQVFNRSMLKDALKDKYQILEASNGTEALKLLETHSKELVAMLLDIVMPEMTGVQLLGVMNEKKYMGLFPVLIITGEQSLDLVEQCFDYGISDFIRKPFKAKIVRKRVDQLVELYIQRNEFKERLKVQTVTLRKQYQVLQKQAEKLKQSNENIIAVMGMLVEYRNLRSDAHVDHVRRFTEILANRVMQLYPEYELTEEKVRIIKSASALHDVGNIMIPENILLKPGKYTDDEKEFMRSHTLRGYDILTRVANELGREYARYCQEICRYHHERYDGKGYPEGLVGDAIPISAQIVSIADSFDALLGERVYKEAYPFDVAFQMIIQGDCGVFSPKLLECFRIARPEMLECVKGTQNKEDVEEWVE